MSGEVRAALIAVLLVAVAAAAGIAAGQRARPAPTARPVPSPTTIALPSATPADPAAAERRAFAQPLSAGCATPKAVWLFSDGGSAIRWDGRAWTIPDPTLRSILAADCDPTGAVAVGRGGSLLTIDDELRQVRVDRFGIEDLAGIDRYDVPGASSGRQQVFAVGTAGTLAHQSELGWQLVATGVTEDLTAVDTRIGGGLRPPPFAWIVGANGISFRLMEQGRWERVATGTNATLRAVVFDTGGAIAVGDRGVLLRYLDAEGAWRPVPSGTDAALNAIALVGLSTAWIVGDRGTVLELSDGSVRRVDIGTTCTLRDVFADGSGIWVIGSDGTRGGAWRVSPGGTERWGTC